jgi:hypothetical protein
MTHPTDALRLATRFHETYERLAPSFGYETRQDTKKFDPETPNGRLMVAVCAELAAAPASPLPGGGTHRVDFKFGDLQSGGDLDDLAISGDLIEMVRVERMSGDSCWGMIYMKDGQHIRLSWSSSKGKLAITAESDA